MAVEIICEAGKNWLTKEDITIPEALENAKKLALVAKECGGDVVKYQCHVAEDEIKKRNSKRHDWILLNEALTPFDTFWKPLKEYCDSISVEMLVTPMSKMATKKINPLVSRFKVASPDIRDFELLKYLKDTGKPIILSSGMCEEPDIDKATDFLDHNYKILLCTSEYPLPIERVGLNEVSYYDGISDHTQSLLVGALAAVKGATIVEKHFTYM